MAKIDITRTELVWPGKYNEDGTLKEVPRVNLPFQVIETVNESRATREAKKGGLQGTLFDVYDGKEGKAMIHIGAVDAPVTIAEIDAAVDECAKLKQGELHVLGWEWEMGLYDLMVEAAKKKGVKLLLLQIPREVMEQQAAAKGDVRFFELAYLEAEIKQPKKLTVQVALGDFVIPNTELIPEEVRGKVKKWSDYIDYWAVDWDFRNDTFMQGWVAYRTRKERKLPLASDPHTYATPGKYRVLVKVIDIFGNDTSQAFDVEVK